MYLNKLLILKKLQQGNTHLGARAHSGTKNSKWSRFSAQRAQSYIFGFRASKPIIDLEKTVISLRRVCNVIQLIIRSNGHLLLINTNPKYNKIIQQTAKRTNQSYINHKWIGGFLTNWNHMQNVQKQFHAALRFSKGTLAWGSSDKLGPLGSFARRVPESGALKKKEREAQSERLPSQFQKDLGSSPRPPGETGLSTLSAFDNIDQKSQQGVLALAEEASASIVSRFGVLSQSYQNTAEGLSCSLREPCLLPSDPVGMKGAEGLTGSRGGASALHKDPGAPKGSFGGGSNPMGAFPRYKKMQKCFEGTVSRETKVSSALRANSSAPDCVVIFNAGSEGLAAIYEAHSNQIPIISVVDSNISNELYNLVTYPIPANCDSVQFIYLFCNCILKTILCASAPKVRPKGG